METRDVTLWKGLRGMNALRPGRYVFTKPMSFRVGPGPLRTRVLNVVYEIS